jgi:hypothetical protein
VSGDRRAGAKHLPCTYLNFIALFGQLHIKSNDQGRKLFCSRPKFVDQPSLSHLDFAIILKAFRFYFPLSIFRCALP